VLCGFCNEKWLKRKKRRDDVKLLMEDFVAFSRVRGIDHLVAYGFQEIDYEDAKEVMFGESRIRKNSGLYCEDDGRIGAIRAVVGPTSKSFERAFQQTIGTDTIVYNVPSWKEEDSFQPKINEGDVLDFVAAFVPVNTSRSQWLNASCGKVKIDKIIRTINRKRPLTKLILKRLH
tara:strand:+ start:1397 stop:1921 length:525 start_codon:yes stop_codon:yes gene_type:complete